MADIIDFDGETKGNVNPDQVLMAAVGEMESTLLLGFSKTGQFYMASSDGELGNLLVLLEMARAAMMDEVMS